MDLFTLLFTPGEQLRPLTHVIEALKYLDAPAESFESYSINKAFSQKYLQQLVPVVGLEPTRRLLSNGF